MPSFSQDSIKNQLCSQSRIAAKMNYDNNRTNLLIFFPEGQMVGQTPDLMQIIQIFTEQV